MKNIVVLGAGTGGTIVANMLSHRLDMKEWRITILDRAAEHIYQPGLLFVPFRLYDYATRADISRPIRTPLPKHVEFRQTEIHLIDHANKQVATADGNYPYDWLVSAMGCHVAPGEIDGMEAAMQNGADTFYTVDGALRLQAALDKMDAGRLVINIAEMPIKCPVAPIEFAFLADYYFERRGNRDRIEIELVTPLSGAFTKPIASRVLSEIAGQKNIRITPNFTISEVDPQAKVINSFEGNSVSYDVLCTIPPNLGPAVIEESGLGDGAGYALTHPRTLKSRKADYVYLLGDNTNVTASKAGSVAHFEAETVVENILREIDGQAPLPSFDGHANCFIESGHHKALLIDFNYDMEPIEGDFPLPGVGPFSLLKETHLNHMGKLAFKWIYWNMLLRGYLGSVPLLPSHMSFMGKELDSVPQIRRSKSVKIENIMSSEVAMVTTGTPLIEASALMTERGVSGLPVVDVEGRLIGVVTEADFLSALDVTADGPIREMFDIIIRRGRRKKTMGTIVDDIMTPKPLTIRRDDNLQKAIDMMDRNHIKRLFIVDDENRVEGVVSRADLMKLFKMAG